MNLGRYIGVYLITLQGRETRGVGDEYEEYVRIK